MLGAVARPRLLRRTGAVPATDTKSGAREKDGHTSARNTQRYRRHSRYPETWPGEICSLDSGNLIDVRLAYVRRPFFPPAEQRSHPEKL